MVGSSKTSTGLVTPGNAAAEAVEALRRQIATRPVDVAGNRKASARRLLDLLAVLARAEGRRRAQRRVEHSHLAVRPWGGSSNLALQPAVAVVEDRGSTPLGLVAPSNAVSKVGQRLVRQVSAGTVRVAEDGKRPAARLLDHLSVGAGAEDRAGGQHGAQNGSVGP